MLDNRPNDISLSRANQSQAKFKSAVGRNLLQSWVNLTIVTSETSLNLCHAPVSADVDWFPVKELEAAAPCKHHLSQVSQASISSTSQLRKPMKKKPSFHPAPDTEGSMGEEKTTIVTQACLLFLCQEWGLPFSHMGTVAEHAFDEVPDMKLNK